jgi:hypothetical protein
MTIKTDTPTWKWLVTVLTGILMLGSGWYLRTMQAAVDKNAGDIVGVANAANTQQQVLTEIKTQVTYIGATLEEVRQDVKFHMQAPKTPEPRASMLPKGPVIYPPGLGASDPNTARPTGTPEP